MFCIVAFLVLAVSGIFSATRRELAKEALDCVLRRVTLRPCITGFDEKMKARILGRVVTRSEKGARILNRNFELFSWLFFLVMLVSSVYVVRGGYLFYVTGSCSGLNDSSFCLFDPKGEHSQVNPVSAGCRVTPQRVADLTLRGVDLSRFPVLNQGAHDRIVLIGCYGCTYTRKVYPILKALALRRKAELIFIAYPVKVKTDLSIRLAHCVYQLNPGRYWELNDRLFAAGTAELDRTALVPRLAKEAGVDPVTAEKCVTSSQTRGVVDTELDEASKTNFYGTPTVFVNGRAFVGPKPYRVYAIALDGLWYWLK